MPDIKINPENKDRRVSHNKVAAKTVAEHTQAELLQLGIIARSSNNPLLLSCFIDLPTMDELVQSKTSADLKQVKDNTLSKQVAATPAAETK